MAGVGAPSADADVIPRHHLRATAPRPLTGVRSLAGPVRALPNGGAKGALIASLPSTGRPFLRVEPALIATAPATRIVPPSIRAGGVAIWAGYL